MKPKCIVHVIRHTGNPTRQVSYLAKKGVLIGPWVSDDVRLNSALLMESHHGRGRKTRHVVISLEQGAECEDSLFEKVAEQFVAAFAPGAEWRGAIDRGKTKCLHMHILLSNSLNGRTLRFSPDTLRQMQQVNIWSKNLLESGKSDKITSRLSSARKLAEKSYEQIRNEIENGQITIARCSKRGEVSSVFYEGRRIRLATIQRVVLTRDPKDRESNIPQVGMDGGMGVGFRQASHAARQRNHRNHSKRRLGHTTAQKQFCKKVSETTQGRDRPDILFQAKTTLFNSRPGFAGTEGVACNPKMERDFGRGFA